MKILKTESLWSSFTGSYEKRVYANLQHSLRGIITGKNCFAMHNLLWCWVLWITKILKQYVQNFEFWEGYYFFIIIPTVFTQVRFIFDMFFSVVAYDLESLHTSQFLLVRPCHYLESLPSNNLNNIIHVTLNYKSIDFMYWVLHSVS